jgi:hypothetical protein
MFLVYEMVKLLSDCPSCPLTAFWRRRSATSGVDASNSGPLNTVKNKATRCAELRTEAPHDPGSQDAVI